MTKEEIKQSTTMQEILKGYGIRMRNNMCSCPFHGEDRHPSMQIFSDGYKCHTCGAHGDIFSFVQEYQGVDFKTAFQILGGTYKRMNPIEHKKANTKYSREKEERDRQAKAAQDFKFHLARTISACRTVIRVCDPMSDMWCEAQKLLPWLEHVWETKYIYEGEVDELNVYRKCRSTEQCFGVG